MTDEFIKDYGQGVYQQIITLIDRYSDTTIRMSLNNEKVQILTKDFITIGRDWINKTPYCYGYVLIDNSVLVEYRDDEIVNYGERVHIPHDFPKDVIRAINLSRILKRNI